MIMLNKVMKAGGFSPFGCKNSLIKSNEKAEDFSGKVRITTLKLNTATAFGQKKSKISQCEHKQLHAYGN